MWKKGNPTALLVGMQTGAATVENSMEFPQKMELPFDPEIPLLVLYPKNSETPIQKNLCTPLFIAVLFTVAKSWKQLKCPSVNEWIKNCGIFTQWNTMQLRESFATAWMELENIMLSEISQLVKYKYRMISPIRGI